MCRLYLLCPRSLDLIRGLVNSRSRMVCRSVLSDDLVPAYQSFTAHFRYHSLGQDVSHTTTVVYLILTQIYVQGRAREVEDYFHSLSHLDTPGTSQFLCRLVTGVPHSTSLEGRMPAAIALDSCCFTWKCLLDQKHVDNAAATTFGGLYHCCKQIFINHPSYRLHTMGITTTGITITML